MRLGEKMWVSSGVTPRELSKHFYFIFFTISTVMRVDAGCGQGIRSLSSVTLKGQA